MSEHDPYRRLNRMLARERLRLGVAIACALLLVALLAVILLPTPRSLGTQWAEVVASVTAARDDGAGLDLDLRLADGTRRRIEVPLIAGIGTGDHICLHLLENPVTGGRTVRRVPDSQCADQPPP